MRCTVTAITPGGRRSTLKVEVRSPYYAVFAYNCHCRANLRDLVIPDRDTELEITPEDGETMRVSWATVADWANRKAEESARRAKLRTGTDRAQRASRGRGTDSASR